ncbi:hypothetical protein ACHAXT_007666 [Thalassiosira profunda]
MEGCPPTRMRGCGGAGAGGGGPPSAADGGVAPGLPLHQHRPPQMHQQPRPQHLPPPQLPPQPQAEGPTIDPNLTLAQLERRHSSLKVELEEHVLRVTAEMTAISERIVQLKEEKKAARRRKRRRCSAEGCDNFAHQKGVCVRHGAQLKRCSRQGCEKKAHRGGTCVKHSDGSILPVCKVDGCALKGTAKGGVCRKHAARCAAAGCRNQVVRKGMCDRHGRGGGV